METMKRFIDSMQQSGSVHICLYVYICQIIVLPRINVIIVASISIKIPIKFNISRTMAKLALHINIYQAHIIIASVGRRRALCVSTYIIKQSTKTRQVSCLRSCLSMHSFCVPMKFIIRINAYRLYIRIEHVNHSKYLQQKIYQYLIFITFDDLIFY